MSSINEIQSRVQAIQAKVTSPPVPGQFGMIFQTQLAVANAQVGQPAQATPVATDEFAVTPQGMTSSSTQGFGSTAVTLGVMLGMSTAPIVAPASGTVATANELNRYLNINNIEARNGNLSTAELASVSGAWNGTGYLLPPAASAWEEMRQAAAGDGIDLRAIDTYRSWESQENAYKAHLRGEKAANVLPPGQSEHGNGLAIDMTNGHLLGVGDSEYTWMRTNGASYGWHPISNESWHWEFRGTGT